MKVNVYQVQAKQIAYVDLTEEYSCKKAHCTYVGGIPKRAEPKVYKIAEAEIAEQKHNKACETIWDMCNISCWDSSRADWAGQSYEFDGGKTHFTEDFEGYCNSDIIVEIGSHLYRAASMGFKEEPTIDSAASYIKTHYWGLTNVERDNMAYDEYMASHE